MFKKIYIFISFLFFIYGISLINPKNYQDKSFECQGNIKTMFLSLPTTFKIKDDYLTIKYTGDEELFKLLKGSESKFKFNFSHSNSVLVEKINSNEISFNAIGVDGTLLLNECELHFPIEKTYSQKAIDYLPMAIQLYDLLMNQ